MRNKSVFLFLLVFFLVLPVFAGCKKTTQVEMKEYQIGETIPLPAKSEMIVQDIQTFASYKIPVSVESVQSFPFVYYQKEEKNYRIIKVNDDGTTLDTIIDGVDSPTYENGYIVEKSQSKKATNSRYLLDINTGELFPKEETKTFVLVHFSYKSKAMGKKQFKPELFWLEDEKQNKIELDPILAETILSFAYPKELVQNQYYSIGLVGLIPKELKTIYFVSGNAKIKWDVETK